jgi:hypothetical protein
VRRWVAAIVLVVVAVAAGWWFLVRDKTVTAEVEVPVLTSTIGSGKDAIAVSSTGRIVKFLPVPQDPPLPTLPISEVPKGGRLSGTVLEEALVLGAAPAALRPYLARAATGELGVAVELTSGIDLYFGDASQRARKWKAVAAVLADPNVTSLDYVNVIAPTHPTKSGEGHGLPPAP